MKKNFMTLIAIVSFSTIAYSQVGINTEEPKATLDVVASPDDANKIDGVIAPRLTGDKLQSKNNLYGLEQEGTIIYATSASPEAGNSVDKTKNVDAPGYYYFDGEFWVKMTGGTTPTKTFKALTGLANATFDFADNENQKGVDFFEFNTYNGPALQMPPASAYKDRIIYIRNISGEGFTLNWQESFETNQLIQTLINMRSVAFASDGTRWSQIAGF